MLVLEQHDRAGGGLHSFEEQGHWASHMASRRLRGFEFETGFHYMGEMKEGQELRSIVDSLTNHKVQRSNLKETCFDYAKSELRSIKIN